MAYLTIVEGSYRGAVEVQFIDVLYGILSLHDQMGGVDLVLRGDSVTTALAGGTGFGVRLGSGDQMPLTDPRQTVRAILARGVAVYVDEPSLRRLGLDGTDLLPGVSCVDTSDLAVRWPEYDGVWYL